MRFLSTLLFFTLLSFSLPAQLIEEAAVMDVGRLRMHINQDGSWGSDEQAFLKWRKDDGDYVSLLQKGGLHYGTLNPDGSLNVDILDGTDNAAGGLSPNFELVGIFKVTKAEVLAHLTDYADNFVIDDPIPAIYSWPGVGNPYLEEYTGITTPTGSYGAAGFWDSDGTGFYDPGTGNTPFLDVRTTNVFCSPEEVPTQMYWLNFRNVNDPNDQMNASEFQMTIASFDCSDAADSALNNRTIILHTKLINLSVVNQIDARLGYRLESAIGDADNDALGTDPGMNITFFYPNEAQDQQFGDQAVPAVGIRALRGPFNQMGQITEINNTLPTYDFLDGPPALGEASTEAEAYNLIQGLWLDGSPLTTGGLGYQTGNATADWPFPGTPGDEDSWTFADLEETPQSIGFITSFEPFLLQPGAVNEMTQIITVTDAANNPFERVASLKEDFNELGDLQLGVNFCDIFTDCSELPSATTETILPELAVQLFPNPVGEQVTIQLPDDVFEAEVSIVDVAGKLWLQSSKVDGGQIQIATGQLPAGVYFATVRTELGQRTLRFVR